MGYSAALGRAVNDAASSKPKDRHDAFTTIKGLVSSNEERSQIQPEEWSKIIGIMSAAIKPDKDTILKKGGSKSDSTVLNRLKAMGQTFKEVIELAGPGIKNSYSKVTKRILELLGDPESETRTFQPLAASLLKALRSLLSHKPYRDQLAAEKDLFGECLRLCVRILTRLDKVKSNTNSSDMEEDSDQEGGGASSAGRFGRRTSTTPGVRHSTMEDLEAARILCLLVFSGRDLTRYENLLFGLFRAFFGSFPLESACQPFVLAAFNHFLVEFGPNMVQTALTGCADVAPSVLKLWETRQSKPEVLYHYRIIALLCQVGHSDSAFSPLDNFFSPLWKRLWAELTAKQPFFAPLTLNSACYAALWTEHDSTEQKLTLAFPGKEEERTWMFLDLVSACADQLESALGRRNGNRTSPFTQIKKTLASGSPSSLCVQTLCISFLKKPSMWSDRATELTEFASALVENISYEDPEITSWILLGLGMVLRNSSLARHISSDFWRRLSVQCCNRLNSPQFSDASAHILADLAERGLIDFQNLNVGWLEGDIFDSSTTTSRFGTGFVRWHRSCLDHAMAQAASGGPTGDTRSHVQAIKQVTLRAVERMPILVAGLKVDDWTLFNAQVLAFQEELRRAWEVLCGKPSSSVPCLFHLELPIYELRLLELATVLGVLNQGLPLPSKNTAPEKPRQYSGYMRSGDVVSYLQTFTNTMLTVNAALQAQWSVVQATTTPLATPGKGRANLAAIWSLAIACRTAIALTSGGFGKEVELGGVKGAGSLLTRTIAEYLAKELDLRPASDKLDEGALTIQALSWAYLAFPLFAQQQQLLCRLHRLSGAKEGDQLPFGGIAFVDEASVAALANVLRPYLVGESSSGNSLGKRKRRSDLDDDFGEQNSQNDDELYGTDFGVSSLPASWYSTSGDGSHGRRAVRDVRLNIVALFRSFVSVPPSSDSDSDLDSGVSRRALESLLEAIEPRPAYDVTTALDAIEAITSNFSMVRDGDCQRLTTAIVKIFKDFFVEEDFWSTILVLRVAQTLVSNIPASSRITAEVSKTVNAVADYSVDRFEAKLFLGRVKVEYSELLRKTLETKLDAAALIPDWGSGCFRQLLQDGDIYLRAHAVSGIPAVLQKFPQFATELVHENDESLTNRTLEQKKTHVLSLTMVAESNMELAGEAVSRMIQLPGVDLQRFVYVCLRYLVAIWNLGNISGLGREMFPSLLFFWLSSDRKLSAFPAEMLGFAGLKDLLKAHKTEVVAQAVLVSPSQVKLISDLLGDAESVLLKESFAKIVAYACPKPGGNDLLARVKKQVDPGTFDLQLATDLDEILLEIVEHSVGDRGSAAEEVAPPEAQAARHLDDIAAGIAPTKSSVVMPVYAWKDSLQGVHLLRKISKDLSERFADPSRVGVWLDRTIGKAADARAPGESERLISGTILLVCLVHETIIKSTTCTQVALQALGEFAIRSHLAARAFVWLVSRLPDQSCQILPSIFMTLSSVLARVVVDSPFRGGVFDCVTAAISRKPQVDSLSLRQLQNVAATFGDSRGEELLQSLDSLSAGNSAQQVGRELDSFKLLSVESDCLLELNIADIVRLASQQRSIDAIIRYDNGRLLAKAMSRLVQLAVRDESTTTLKSNAVRALSALGYAQTNSTIRLQSPFSFGYSQLAYDPKQPHLPITPMYQQTIALLLRIAGNDGSSPAALCSRTTLRLLLRTVPSLVKMIVQTRQLTPFVAHVEEFAKAPTSVAVQGLNMQTTLTSLGGSATVSRDVWLLRAFELLVPRTHSVVFRHLRSIVGLRTDLVDEILPFLVYTALNPPFDVPRSKEDPAEVVDRNKKDLSDLFRGFFASFNVETPWAISSMIRALLFLRAQKPTKEIEFFLGSLDWWLIANAALKTKMFTAALLFAEQLGLTADSLSGQDPTSAAQRTMVLEIFESIDNDNFDAMQFMNSDLSLVRPAELNRRFEHERQWYKNLGLADATGGFQARARSLAGLGLFATLRNYGRGQTSSSNSALADLQVEAAWRTASWEPIGEDTTGSTFNAQIFTLMDNLRSNAETDVVLRNLSQSYLLCGTELTNAGVDGWPKVQSVLQKSLLIRETEEIALASRGGDSKLKEVTQLWDSRLQLLKEGWSFEDIEPLLSARTQLLLLLKQRPASGPDPELVRLSLCEHLLSLARMAREASSTQLAIQQLAKLNGEITAAPESSPLASWDWKAGLKLEEAKTLWAWDEHNLAIRALKTFAAEKHPQSLGGGDMGPVLTLLGKFIGTERLEQPLDVIANYLNAALKKTNNNRDLGSALHTLAEYADEQLAAFRASGKLDSAKMRAIEKNQEVQADKLAFSKMNQKDPNRHQVHNKINRDQKLAAQDDAMVTALESEEKHYLEQAVFTYVKSLQVSDDFDHLDVSRLVALWLSHSSTEYVNDALIKARIDKVESRKFVGLVYQLSARLLTAQDKFQKTLFSVLRNMAKDHPFHTLPTIFALKNTDTKTATDDVKSRAGAALALFTAVQKDGERSRDRATQMDSLLKAYDELAKIDMKAQARSKQPSSLKQYGRGLATIKDFKLVPVLTRDLPIDPSCEYKNIVSVRDFKDDIGFAGGITVPKKIVCRGSDGNDYTQLVKLDDVRQDAVFTSVFRMINELLYGNASTRQRRLRICTYTVLPLSTNTGVLEWYQGSVALGDWLGKAHPRYHKSNYSPEECRQMLNSAGDQPADKTNTLKKILRNFQPVFRKFFEENYRDPQVWFERRQAYTKSVATMAIVGWIVGLGDRHVNNMLLSQDTGELVHIDFGIAFEHGKLLSVPETVPFRLTQDTVDGFGLTGVEGLFRKSCEAVLALMRSTMASNMLLTLLDVFRFDPLLRWTPAVRNDNYDSANVNAIRKGRQNGNLEAQRSIDTIRNKLSNGVSVQCQINELIQTATNVELLAQLFAGWQPYL